MPKASSAISLVLIMHALINAKPCFNDVPLCTGYFKVLWYITLYDIPTLNSGPP